LTLDSARIVPSAMQEKSELVDVKTKMKEYLEELGY
jgi:hypothetical protein